MLNQELTEAQLSTLDWMDEVVGVALKEARDKHSTATLNRLGKNDSLSYYINNVHGTHTMSREQFARQYPGLMAEATQLHADYLERITLKEAVEKVTPLEEQLKELKGMFEAQAEELKLLKEAQKPADKPVKKPTKTDPDPEKDETE